MFVAEKRPRGVGGCSDRFSRPVSIGSEPANEAVAVDGRVRQTLTTTTTTMMIISRSYLCWRPGGSGQARPYFNHPRRVMRAEAFCSQSDTQKSTDGDAVLATVCSLYEVERTFSSQGGTCGDKDE